MSHCPQGQLVMPTCVPQYIEHIECEHTENISALQRQCGLYTPMVSAVSLCCGAWHEAKGTENALESV